MSDYQITLPSKPRVVSEENFSGSYEVDGLYPGYGHTLGNSLRRIILSSLPGAAITHVKIDGVQHEFSTIDGVKEDVVVLLLNLKKVRIKMATEEPQTLRLRSNKAGAVVAGDIEAPGQVEILNPEQHIAELSSKGSLDIEMRVEKGLGYVPKEVLQKERTEIGSITLDAVFSPIRRVNYEVENMRVGDRTDFNRLRMFIETDGTIMPREALESAITIMIHQLKAIVGFQEESEEEESAHEEDAHDAGVGEGVSADATDAATAKADAEKETMKTRIAELGLSTRVEAALDEAGIRTVGGLARKREEDVLALEGLGQKGLQEIKRALSNLGITLRQ